MRCTIILLVVAGALNTSSVLAQSNDEMEIKALIAGQDPIPYSANGALEFWSSGGLVHAVSASGRTLPFDEISLEAKHIEVLVLVPGEAAVAHYYSEGSMTPAGHAAVPDYLTRATQVFVKEDGEWRVRSSHWSPVRGSSGTSQWAAPAPAADDSEMSQ
jgi:hypothetical protein